MSLIREENFALPAQNRWPSCTLSEPKSRLPVDYPSEWFAAHPGSKPIACVKRCFASEKDLLKAVFAGLAAGRLPVEYVVQFMYMEGSKIQDTLTDDWKSFGVTIGCAGEKISPWELLTVTEKLEQGHLADVVPPAVNGSGSPDRASLFALVVCIYRLLVAKYKGGSPDYIQRLQDNNLRRVLVLYRCNRQYLEGAEKKFEHWLKDASYLSLIAALDMFFHHFDRHRMAILRAGTHVSRYKHCAVLDDIKRLCMKTRLEPYELFEWLFVERAADEIDVIFQEGQELYVEQSYAPYLIDLGLSRRSPYSATANPMVHYWCNATAALRGSSQSRKSRVTYDGDLSGLTVNAMILAYAINIRQLNSMCAPVGQSSECLEVAQAAEDAPRESGQMPKVFKAAQWYQYLSEKSFIVDPGISKYCLVMLGTGMPDGSVGAKLLEIISQLKQ